MKDTKSLAWLLPVAGLLILFGWFLGRAGWNFTKLDVGIGELEPPTATSASQTTQPTLTSPTVQPSQPIATQPQQITVNCSFIDELVAKADVIQRLYEGQSLAGVQARLLYPIDVPIGWTVHKDGKEYYGPIHLEAGVVASFWSPVSCRPLNINQ